MNSDKILLITIIATILVIQNAAAAGTVKKVDVDPILQNNYYRADCSCICKGAEIFATGLSAGDLNPLNDGEKRKEALDTCERQCARTCALNSSCSEKNSAECGTCCDKFCAASYSGAEKSSCKDTCSGKCTQKGLIKAIVDIFYQAAGIIGALMIVIQGIRMIVSKDVSERDNAKKGIMYVIAALFIIVIAGTLTVFFLS